MIITKADSAAMTSLFWSPRDTQSRKQLKSQKQMQTQMDADSPVQWHIWNYSAVLLFGVFVNAVKALAAWCWSVSHGEIC